jgi:hypothetical protein
MQGLKRNVSAADAGGMKSRQIAARLAIAGALFLSSGSLVACTGREHKEVVDVADRTKKQVEGIEKQLENRAESIVNNS